MALGRNVVDTVNDIVGLALQQHRRGSLIVKVSDGLNFCLWIDLLQALGQDVGLELANRPLHGLKLAIAVGDANFIKIHQPQLTHAGTAQSLGRQRTHPAQSDDHDFCAQQSRHLLVAHQSSNSIEAPVQAVVVLYF